MSWVGAFRVRARWAGFGVLCALLSVRSASAAEPKPARAEPTEDAPGPRAPAGEGEAEPPAPQSTPSSRATVYDLRRCLRLAAANYPKVLEARAKLAHKRAQRSQAHTQPFSDFTFTAGITLAPDVRGTSIYSPDSDVPIKSDMGLAWQVGLDGLIPLWTFGKITNTWDAADAQVAVGEHELRKEKNDVMLAVRRAYYGALLAHDALLLIREAAERIDKYLTPLADKVEAGEGDEIDLLKLQIQREELAVRESEVIKQERIALSGLRFLTGVTGAFALPDLPLKQAEHRLAPLAHYLAAARLHRPEINMARAGILARAAQARVARARLFPDFGIGVTARYTNAPGITDQRNPFVYDRGHGEIYGAALVMRYKLDFLPQSARLAQAEAELEEIRATERYALGGVGVEVEQAFREAADAARRLEAHGRAVSLTKRWLLQVQQGIDVGTFEDRDIVDPAKEYALKRFAQMSATFDYNVAIARLAQATGWEELAASE